jgi:hypothetical protein
MTISKDVDYFSPPGPAVARARFESALWKQFFNKVDWKYMCMH